ncbi:Rv0361 family membrane protein [Mycobacteroides abscessus]|uniref:Rv0361 family membrane protein n=1 Tax=Mycobacteroides abscessus TaxID=36809 RepID=UPI0010405924|nr:nuclear transport factor 2 family protein [Mycobacteroides abscessus]
MSNQVPSSTKTWPAMFAMAVLVPYLLASCAQRLSPEEEVRQDFNKRVEAYNAGDLARYNSFLCPSFVSAINSSGLNTEPDKNMKDSLAAKGKLIVASFDQVNVSGDTATANVLLEYEKISTDVSYHPVMMTFKRANGTWKQCQI